MTRVLVPDTKLSPEDLAHIADWPEDLTDIDASATARRADGELRTGIVWFYSEDREWQVAFTFEQIQAHRLHDRGTPLNFRRLVEAEIESSRRSHMQGGARVTSGCSPRSTILRP